MKKVLFVCVENACRSQIAEAFFNKLANGKAIATNAGTKPSMKVNLEADRVITLGCDSDVCSMLPVETEDWQIEDFSGKSTEEFREVREEIKRRVERLIEELGFR